MSQPPLEIVLEFARAQSAAEPFGSPLSDQEYLLRRGDGDYASARFPWSEELRQDLLAFERARADAQAVKRLGHMLRDFLAGLGWGEIERDIEEALAQEREVHLTVRCGVSELYGVPLDLVTLGKTGPTLAALPGCHLRYEWPETHSARPEVAPSPEGGRIVFAWSAAGGPVPAEKHLQAIDAAAKGCQLFDPGIEIFKPAEDELRHVSLAALSKRLEAARASQTPIAALHLLCHGGKLPGETKSYGLRWNSSRDPQAPEWVDPAALERVLHPYAGLVRMVVLCACQGANAGAEDNHLGSVAQALHRIGIPVVVTSRYPLSVPGSNELTERLYQTLLAGEPMHRAVATARQALANDASTLDWAALQVYSRAEDGADVYPFTFRPYRGLLTFEARHARFFFGREELTKKLRQRTLDAAEGKLPRFQVVAGISGSGKSSLVKAGLVPTLGEGWDTAELRPSEGAGEPGPLALLVRKLRALRGEAAGSEPATTEFVLGEAKRLREAHPTRKLLLVVDQFEEVFTALAETPSARRCGNSRETRRWGSWWSRRCEWTSSAEPASCAWMRARAWTRSSTTSGAASSLNRCKASNWKKPSRGRRAGWACEWRRGSPSGSGMTWATNPARCRCWSTRWTRSGGSARARC